MIARCSLYCISWLFFIGLCTEVFAQARFAKTNVQLAKLQKLQTAVESNPGNLKTHEAFIEALDPDDPYLKSQYAIWLKRFPKSPIVPFAIGRILESRRDPDARNFLLKSVELKPDLAEAWNLLAMEAELKGESELFREYSGHAKKVDPENPKYAFFYAYSHKDLDPVRYDSLMLAVVFRFPESEPAALALYWLAENSKNENEKIAFYEQLLKRYSARPSNSSSFGIDAYFNFLLDKNPQKAFEVALNMVIEPKTNHYEWDKKLKYARAFRDAKSFLDKKESSITLEILRSIPEFQNHERYILLKTEAIEATISTTAAYDSLSAIYAKRPGDKIRIALLNYGEKLNKNDQQVESDIFTLREYEAIAATDFSLELYDTIKRVSLADYKGKIILLTHWFPACSPCRAEFPHFESVIKKFSNQEVIYLAINTERKQDAYVMPFIKSKNYSFIPLKEEPRDKGNLIYNGVPKNYLIDQKGKIIFSDFRIDESNEDMLELMITELLKKERIN